MIEQQFLEKQTAARIIVLAAPRMTKKALAAANIRTLVDFETYHAVNMGAVAWRAARAKAKTLAAAFVGVGLPKSQAHVDRTLGWLGVLRKCDSCHKLESPQRPLILYPEGGFRNSPVKPRKPERDKWFCDGCGVKHCLEDTEEWPEGSPVVVFREAKTSTHPLFQVKSHWEWITLVKHFGTRVKLAQGRNVELVDAALVRHYPPRQRSL